MLEKLKKVLDNTVSLKVFFLRFLAIQFFALGLGIVMHNSLVIFFAVANLLLIGLCLMKLRKVFWMLVHWIRKKMKSAHKKATTKTHTIQVKLPF